MIGAFILKCGILKIKQMKGLVIRNCALKLYSLPANNLQVYSLKGSSNCRNVADWEAIDILVGFSNIFIDVKFFAEKCLQK